MYRINLHNITDTYEFNELIKIFLNPKVYTLDGEGDVIDINLTGSQDKHQIKREIYQKLSEITGKKPAWGTLTGVRPVKLAGEIGDKEILMDKFLLSSEKADLILDTYERQQKVFGKPPVNSAGVYIGIPFCPTRCSYCSFASNQVDDLEKDRYLQALFKEIDYVREKHPSIESIYIGGGTPTSLNEKQLNLLLDKVNTLDLGQCKEYTIEAGRPDTITREKLEIIKAHGIERISINPQSMKDHTLELIGRKHSSKAILEAFKLAHEVGIKDINADIIAGLPEETVEDFKSTLKQVIDLGPTNITVHTLAIKRASKLHEEDKDYHYKQGGVVEAMLAESRKMLSQYGYTPYYLYRQKHMAGAFENVGYTLQGSDCLYNVRIMEEKQSIIAMGAGGISKAYYPLEDRHERVPNVTNYQIYIERIDEMIKRKEDNLFRR
ncbi:MAG: coproporphyrinogen dehydrogenase HemZ [Clostridia bacterium]|nr:coproporphyrinogen dehydrogenase HemZ [Clostridia bacterium]